MANYYWVGGTGTWDNASKTNWSTSSGGAGGAGPPLAADAVLFDANSGTGTCTTGTGATCQSVSFNTATVTLTLGGNLTVVSAFILTSGSISLGANTLTMRAMETSNANVRSIDFGTGKIALTGNATTVWNHNTATNFTSSGSKRVELTYSGSTGTRTVNGGSQATMPETAALNFYVTAGSDIVSISVAVCTLDFTGFTGALSNNTRFVYGDFILSSGMTVNAGTATTNFASTNASARTITSNGKTLDFPLTFNGIGGTWTCSDALAVGSTRTLTLTNGTLKLKDGATSSAGAVATSGTNQKYLQSTVPGTQAILSDASGTNSLSYVTISDINVTGGAVWDAFVGNGNVDAGNNAGWNFGIGPLPVGSGAYNLRSFTERDHF